MFPPVIGIWLQDKNSKCNLASPADDCISQDEWSHMNNITDLATLKRLHSTNRRIFGLDLGTKTIGLALSDGLLTVASPLRTIHRTKFTKDANELLKLSEKLDVFALVIGLPLNMDGSEGPRAQSTRAFARNLAPILPLPVAFWDERLSTVAAERFLLEADYSRRKRAAKIDATAASLILQGALDRMRKL
jgi:putative holliday junction resolvase